MALRIKVGAQPIKRLSINFLSPGSMKGTVKYCLAVAFLLITGCGDGSNESAGSRADGSNGTAVISVNGVEIEITSVSCRAQDSTYSVRASGPTHRWKLRLRRSPAGLRILPTRSGLPGQHILWKWSTV